MPDKKSKALKGARLAFEKVGLMCFSFAILGMCVAHMYRTTYYYHKKEKSPYK